MKNKQQDRGTAMLDAKGTHTREGDGHKKQSVHAKQPNGKNGRDKNKK